MFHHRLPTGFFILMLSAAGARAQTVGASELTLRQAIQQAIDNNLQTNLARERTVEAKAHVGTARSALLPNVSGVAYQMNLTANLAAMGLSSSTFPGIPAFIGPYSRFDARFQMVQNLFSLPAIRHYQASRLGVGLAELRRGLTEQHVIAATILAYIGVLEAKQAVAAAEANVQLSRRLLDLAISQRNAGIATGLDVARAETRLAGQQVQLAQAQTRSDTAGLTLLRVTGSPLNLQPSTTESMRFDPQPLREPGDVIHEALDGRVELRAAAEQLRIAELERKAALGGLTPSVSAFGDYGNSGLKPNEVNLPTRSIGIRIDVPIFNGGRTRSEVQIASSRVRQAELQLADLRSAVEKDVRQALDNLATVETQMKAAQKNLDLAQRELSLAQDRFQNGVADNIEVTNAQTALENARQLVVASLAQYNIARLNLYSSMGRAQDFSF